MAYRGDTASLTQFDTPGYFGLPSLFGGTGTEGVMAFPGTAPSQGYTVTHNGPNTPGSSYVEEYTMIWDLLYPESSDIAWRSLLQTSPGNGNDGELFIKNWPAGGIGISNDYDGAVQPDAWERIAITRDSSGTWTKYINGGYIDEQNAGDSRFALDPTFHLFTDNNHETQPGYTSSFRFLDRSMTGQEVFELGGVHAGGAATPGQVFHDPSDVAPGSFTIAVLGDTQNYSQYYPDIYAQQTQWLVDNQASRNIQFTLHVGDVVNSDHTTQWNSAMNAMETLDGRIPYAVVPGNHDYSDNRNVSEFDQTDRFGPGSPYASQSTLTGSYPAEPNSRMNTYHTFEANDRQFLVLALEFGPRDDVVAWAETVVDAHPDHRAILLTHAYMFDGGMWFDASPDPDHPGQTYDQVRDTEVNHFESIYNPHSYGWATNANDGKELWDALVKDRENFSLVITGHQFDERDGFPYLLTQGENGNDVYQMLVDMQARDYGGEGWIRLLEFDPDGVTLRVKTYSPFFDRWSYASDEYFTIPLSALTSFEADFNGNGVVDRDDFAVWQTGFGNGTSHAEGDADTDGDVDGNDFLVWQRQFGSGTSGAAVGAAVPEPTTWTLVGLLLIGLTIFHGFTASALSELRIRVAK